MIVSVETRGLEKSYFNMENLCRICLCSPKQLQPLFDGTQISEKIRIISSVVIEENDGFPNSACDDCIINVNTCYNFRLVVINSDVELRQRATESSKVIDEEAALLTSELIIKREESDFDLEQTDEGQEREVVEERVIKEEEVESDVLEIKKYECNKCDFVTENLKLYRKHNRVGPHKSQTGIGKVESDEPEKKIYECQKCGFITQNSKLYQKHNHREKRTTQTDICNVKSEKPEIRTYVCMKCDFVTEDLKLHRKHNHREKPKPEDLRCVCSICGKMLYSNNMVTHMKSHEANPTACDVCGKMYRNSASMRNHKLSHRAPNICEYCGKSYSHRTDYYVHVKRYHKGGMKKYNCSRCDKTFIRTCALNRHMRSHTGERPYKCEFCQKGFSSGNALKTHRLQHTNEMPYKCKLCMVAFKQRVLLRNHLKTKHPGQEYSF